MVYLALGHIPSYSLLDALIDKKYRFILEKLYFSLSRASKEVGEIIAVLKTCTKCGVEKDISCFSKKISAKDGLRSWCKSCCKISGKRYREDNRDKGKKYREDNKDKKAVTDRKYAAGNRDKIIAQKREYKIKNRAIILKYSKEYNNRNKNRMKLYQKDKRATDIQFRIRHSLRSRIGRLVKKNRPGSSVKDLGCTIGELRIYLESRFQLGMTWENWGGGPGKWNIDHIMPLTAFDLTDRQHFVLAVHYCNLQPLWFEDNMKKFNKIPNLEQLFYAAA